MFKEDEMTPEGWLRRWAQALSGCLFASQLAVWGGAVAARRMDGPVRPGLAADLDPVLLADGEANHAVLFAFPALRTAQEVVGLVEELSKSDRWQSQELLPPAASPLAGRLIKLTWRTAYGRISHVMGVGPFGTMPVTRRAPHVGLIVWPGHEKNPMALSRPGAPDPKKRTTIGLTDMPTKTKDQEEHDGKWADTERVVGILTPEWDDLRRHLRTVAFCLDFAGSPKFSQDPKALTQGTTPPPPVSGG